MHFFLFSKRLKLLWDRARKHISESESRIRSETQLIHGEEFEVWRWIQPRSSSPSPVRRRRAVRIIHSQSPILIIDSFQESPESSNEESHVYMPTDVGLTPCLKLRNFFDPDS